MNRVDARPRRVGQASSCLVSFSRIEERMDRAMLFGLLVIGTVLALILDQVRTGGYYRTSVFEMIEQAPTRVSRFFR